MKESPSIDISKVDSPIILFGFKAVGKTTLGKLLAEDLQRPFYDLDEMICKNDPKGRGVREIYKEEGREAFVEYERSAIQSLPDIHRGVVATGGATLMDLTCANLLSEMGLLVHVKERKELVKERIFSRDLPPFLLAGDSEELFEKIWQERMEHYQSICKLWINSSSLQQAILSHRSKEG